MAAGGAALAALVAINALAYAHARAFTSFAAPGATRTRSPGELTSGEKVGALLGGVTLPRPENRRTPADVGLSFESHALVASDGVRLEAWRVPHPRARAVAVLGHGYGGAKASMLDVGRELHALGLELVLLDFRGSGGSDGDRTSIGVHEARDVEAAATFARASSPRRPLLLHGVSMGTAAALRAVHVLGVHPDAIIVESPFDRLVTTVEHRFELMGVPPWPAGRLLLFWGGAQLGFDAEEHAPVEYARSVVCPTLVVGGEEDPYVRPDELRSVAGALGGRTDLWLVPGVRHESVRAKHPDEWRARVAAFLDQALSSSTSTTSHTGR